MFGCVSTSFRIVGVLHCKWHVHMHGDVSGQSDIGCHVITSTLDRK